MGELEGKSLSNLKRRNCSLEFKDKAVQLVLTGPGTVTDVARKLGLNPQTLRNWVNEHQENEPGAEPPLSVSERARLRELEREVIEPREQTRFLGKRRPSSRRHTGEREVRVHQQGGGRVQRGQDVCVAEGVQNRLLRLAHQAGIGNRRATRSADRADRAIFADAFKTYEV